MAARNGARALWSGTRGRICRMDQYKSYFILPCTGDGNHITKGWRGLFGALTCKRPLRTPPAGHTPPHAFQVMAQKQTI